MNELPAVCIMIPTYNQANYISQAVESALAQDYTNLSIFVADDNSTDDTEQVLQRYIQNNQIQYIKNNINLGRVANYRRTLYEATTAAWVLNLDGDDYLTDPQYISKALQAIIDEGTNEVLFFQGSHIYMNNGQEEIHQPHIKGTAIVLKGHDYFFNYFQRRHFSHMSTLYNRKLAMASGFYELDLISSDIFSVMQLCLNFSDKKVIVSKNISGVWLQHDMNSSKTLHIGEHLDNFSVYKKLYSLAVNKGFGSIRCLSWLLKARYMYLRSYGGAIIRKLKHS